ncbi:unnamed protein product [Prorocentrum cordatum]|uniref:Uncharacterized protein n=1 Tax=Prorocentrum cordatum TaxID=2364126 RepID=A0ABN9QWD6_9DINO|nr:unnamed protein product [Polarella glacialis]
MGGEKGAGEEEEEEEEEGEPNGRQRARADSEASPAAPRPGEGPGRIRVPPAGRRPERAELTWGARRGVPMREGSDRCLCGGAVDVQRASDRARARTAALPHQPSLGSMCMGRRLSARAPAPRCLTSRPVALHPLAHGPVASDPDRRRDAGLLESCYLTEAPGGA